MSKSASPYTKPSRAAAAAFAAMGLFTCATLVGCGGASGTEYEGVYNVSRYAISLDDCDVEADEDQAIENWMLFVKNRKVDGRSVVLADLCFDDAECDAAMADASIGDVLWTFISGSDADGWSGIDGGAQLGANNQCVDGIYTEIELTRPATDALRIEILNYPVEPFDAGPGGDCSNVAQHALLDACNGHAVLDAVLN